jgi:hypothetical protein
MTALAPLADVITLFKARTTDGAGTYYAFDLRGCRAMIIVSGTTGGATIGFNVKDQYGNVVALSGATPGTALTFADKTGTAIIELPYGSQLAATAASSTGTTSVNVTVVRLSEMR